MHCTICFIVLGLTAVCFDCTQLDARAFATDRVFIKRNRTATNDGNTNWTLTPGARTRDVRPSSSPNGSESSEALFAALCAAKRQTDFALCAAARSANDTLTLQTCQSISVFDWQGSGDTRSKQMFANEFFVLANV